MKNELFQPQIKELSRHWMRDMFKVHFGQLILLQEHRKVFSSLFGNFVFVRYICSVRYLRTRTNNEQ